MVGPSSAKMALMIEVFGSHLVIVLGVGCGAAHYFQHFVGATMRQEPQYGYCFVNAFATHGIHYETDLARTTGVYFWLLLLLPSCSPHFGF